MTTKQKINSFAIGLPILIFSSYPIFKESALFFALLSIMLTGFIQLLLGLFSFTNNTKDKYYQLYLFVVISFFPFWYYCNTNNYNNNYCTYALFTIPSLLAIYLSVVIYKNK